MENNWAGQPGGTRNFGAGYRVIQATELALRRYLAEQAFGFPWLRRFHGFAARHFRRHRTAIVGAHAHLHRTISRQAAGRQPTDGKRGAEQQEEQCPKKFHGWDYSRAILSRSRGIFRQRRSPHTADRLAIGRKERKRPAPARRAEHSRRTLSRRTARYLHVQVLTRIGSRQLRRLTRG